MAINVDRPVLDCVISNMEEIQPHYQPHLHAYTKHDHAYISERIELYLFKSKDEEQSTGIMEIDFEEQIAGYQAVHSPLNSASVDPDPLHPRPLATQMMIVSDDPYVHGSQYTWGICTPNSHWWLWKMATKPYHDVI
ncbi:hypothetical protein EV424DRAFT_1347045 [Suillus variegatus]|nr:hypothetical protein EV424DRAFT_1347045 [Suillus variegatus]